MNKSLIIQQLGLEPHPKEGGYFKRTYSSPHTTLTDNGKRLCCSAIYYLLSDDQPIGYLHRNRSDIIHYFHCGYPLRYLLVTPQGELEEHWLGNDLLAGQQPQLLIAGGYWKAAILEVGDFALISESVSPGFEYADNELATSSQIISDYPQLWQQLEIVTKKELA